MSRGPSEQLGTKNRETGQPASSSVILTMSSWHRPRESRRHNGAVLQFSTMIHNIFCLKMSNININIFKNVAKKIFN